MMRRDLIYELGDWEESYAGHSTLFGHADLEGAHLQRRTAWLGEPKAGRVTGSDMAPRDSLHEPRMLPLTCAALTTWTSHLGVGTETVARYLRGNEMVIRRTHYLMSLTAMKSAGEEPVVSEETFVKLGDNADLEFLCSQWPHSLDAFALEDSPVILT